VSLYPLGISRGRDVPSVPKQAAGSIDVRWSLAEDLACAFIDARNQAIPPMLHASVLDAIHRRICVLPVRFGVALQSEADIQSWLCKRQHELLDQLSRLDGACEMGVRIGPLAAMDERRPTSSHESNQSKESSDSRRCPLGHPSVSVGCPPTKTPVAVPYSGKSPQAYMEERRSHYHHADEDATQSHLIVQQFTESLDGYFRQWRRLSPSPSHSIRLAFLIERDRATAFQGRVKLIRDTCWKGLCVVLGPWPPYSFVEALAEGFHADVGGV
jgi:hypothetical protein